MNNPQPSIATHRDPGSTTHSKYSFAKTPRFPSNNAMYLLHHLVAHKHSTPFNPNYPTEKQDLDMAKKWNFQVFCLTPPQLIATASIHVSSRPKDHLLVQLEKNHRTDHT